MKKKTTNPARRIALNAVLIAMYVLLGFWKIPIGNLLRVNLASFAVVVCAVAVSPVDALIVGFLGEFLSQVLGPYGLTPTTVLWALPEAVRGVLLGLFVLLFTKRLQSFSKILRSKAVALFLVTCAFTGIIASLFNTFALFVDSKMYGYYNYYMVFGVLLVRLGVAAVMSGMFGLVTLYITAALERNKII